MVDVEPEDEADTDAHDEEADANSEAEADAESDGEPVAPVVGDGQPHPTQWGLRVRTRNGRFEFI